MTTLYITYFPVCRDLQKSKIVSEVGVSVPENDIEKAEFHYKKSNVQEADLIFHSNVSHVSGKIRF